MFCLNKNIVNAFLNKLKSGEIDPKALGEMPSKERRAFFAEFMGEANAEKTNALFESKLLLKNQQQGMINWAKEVTGLKPPARKALIERIENMKEVLTPESEKAFLADLAAHKIGATVTMEETATIAKLAKDVQDKKAEIQSGGDRLEYGRAIVKFSDYVADLKNETQKMTVADAAKNPVGAAKKGLVETAGLAKSLKASIDNSVIGRQGLKVLFTHPGTWLKNSAQSFVDIARTFGGKEVLNEVRADVLSRPNAMNGLYRREKLAIGVIEEAYPTSLPEKIPGLGKVFKASSEAFTAFQYRTRADVFDKYVQIAEKSGGDIQGVGLLVNSLTGRGNIGPLEPVSKGLNNIFFSPRFLKSNIDILSGQVLDYGGMGKFAKQRAAINTLKVVSGVAGILTVANAVSPNSVEEDARSSDFGKIRVGNTRFDVSGGMAPIVTLAARWVSQSTKSSATGKIKKINSGKFGSMNTQDLIMNFFENKLSPAASVLNDFLKGRDREGNKPSLTVEIDNLFTPLPIKNYQELKDDPESADMLLAMIADGLGIGTNTYSGKKK